MAHKAMNTYYLGFLGFFVFFFFNRSQLSIAMKTKNLIFWRETEKQTNKHIRNKKPSEVNFISSLKIFLITLRNIMQLPRSFESWDKLYTD